jgi:glutaredoxin-like YruB-family protein
MIQIKNHNELLKQLERKDKIWVLLFKSANSEQSICAYEHLIKIEKGNLQTELIAVDVTQVKDIHANYGVTTVPTLLEFHNGELKNTIKGCHDAGYYENMFNGSAFAASSTAGNTASQKNITVYSTPTCSWCNTLKSFLRDHNIKFRDVDVSKDTKAAEDMVKRSGQQGVPQTLINGEVIVGFDKPKISKLLGIQSK